MLHNFLLDHRDELIDRCKVKAAERSVPNVGADAIVHGIPIFLEQLIGTLRRAHVPDSHPGGNHPVATSADEAEKIKAIDASATRHGAELLRHNFTIDQVVHDYGDLCQAITELATERVTHIDPAEFRILNQTLDNAIAVAVAEYSTGRARLLAVSVNLAETERLGQFAHELRNHLHTATLALTAIKAGNVGLGGATGAILDRSLVGLRVLIERSLGEVRVRSGHTPHLQRFSLAEFIDEACTAAALEARTYECALHAPVLVDPALALEADRDLLMAALGNLLQNAFKFSRRPGEVHVTVLDTGKRVLIDVADSCGGIPPEKLESLAQPFVQAASDRTGLGLGLTVVKRSVEANHGRLLVRDHAPFGCVFTIEMPHAT